MKLIIIEGDRVRIQSLEDKMRSGYGDAVEPRYQEYTRESKVKEGDFKAEVK